MWHLALLDLFNLLTQLFLLLGRKCGLEAKQLSNARSILVLDQKSDMFRANLEQLFHLQIVGCQHQCKQRIVIHAADKALFKSDCSGK
jgi:hypothetical protein